MNADDLIDRLAGELSLARRVLNVLVLLGGLGAAVVVGLLWATEPGLPRGTQAAFAVMVLVGLGWAGYGGWAVTRRTPLFALDRLIAAGLAVVATAVVGGTVITVELADGSVEPVAVGTFAGLLALAVVNLWRASRHRSGLLRRKLELGG